MRHLRIFCLLLMLTALSCGRFDKSSTPLSLHPANQHYFLFRNKPAILIGSTEHYGAVLNLDFNYIAYLDELASSGLNVTRTFSGIYLEASGAFGIMKNTLAPAPGRYICPFARSSEPDYANGGNKFDLDKWDDEYFIRLKDFIKQAGQRNIIVELDLFSNFYDTVQWKLSPLYITNNVNGTGNIRDQKEILSLRHPDMLQVQERMVRKIITELKSFDNLYYEICNEPYFGDTTALREWETHMTGIVVDAEKDFRQKHLISNNVQNFYRSIAEPLPGVSIYNFHYAKPPVTVPANYHLNKVIGDNETGFNGIHDTTYRTEAWDFLLAGGGLFNHLDYSFTADNEDGSYIIGEEQPGGGGKTLRKQFKILADFMQSADFVHMRPDTALITLPAETNTSIHALSGSDGACLAYFHRPDASTFSSEVYADLPDGSYTLTWIDTKSGDDSVADLRDHKGRASFVSPEYSVDIALRIVKYE